ncbi:MAG TPA: septal ring lytic transglycosylase RlpA family protein [Thermosulfidibacter takaii]|uniref:Probable endolytic peptidoglycan transglycosylase RlpA n=1 Tax=Thermosulfidibacter takaii TaxID=412593 RepID=A0A7C0Y614_9BACT|nr:septal ring lytic transglycosylase RlpA family protein [Thermosulfidibacter takaii]
MGGPRWLLLVGLLLFLVGCGGGYRRVPRVLYPPPKPGWTQVGIASWYGWDFHGRKTANGEVYNMYDYTAAHRTLPFGTYVRVLNLDNGRSVVVRINDRGPFVKGRIIDLSYAAARAIDMIGPGTARVQLTVLPARPRALVPVGVYYVQVGSFVEPHRAYALQRTLLASFSSVKVRRAVVDGVVYYRVRVGPFFSRTAAEGRRRWLRRRGYPAVVVRE